MADRLGSWLRHRYERRRFEEDPFGVHHIVRGSEYLLKQRYGRRDYTEEAVREYRVHPGLSGWASDRPDLVDPIRIVAVGDLLWHPEPLADYLSPALRQWLGGTDVLMVNLETPVTASRRHQVKLPLFTFSANPRILEPFASLAGVGTVAFSVVNNHCLDQHDGGLLDTIDEVRRVGGVPLGVTTGSEVASRVLDVRGTAVGLTAWAGHLNRPSRMGQSGLDLNISAGLVDARRPAELELVERELGGLRSAGAELLAVSLHWGYEHERIPDPLQRGIARRLGAAGPTLIAGHHPHLAQPVELIDTGARARSPNVAAYSLGNFVSDMQRRDWSLGLALDARFARSPDGVALASYEVQPLFIWRSPQGCFVDLFEPERLLATLPACGDLIAGVGHWWERLRDGRIVDDSATLGEQGEQGAPTPGDAEHGAHGRTRPASMPGE